ncbi:alpha/beta hydrolase [Pseudoblastomonas halimionae]|uniref:Alpha/beta fold hydrolase n=1 Tax=Alteriqipengyuania halimionae TaxID=1926630 RepID=A0A6I4U3V4_9SPHN|nr:alpha/beta fold hydrolase [Alteriqipengyuania halimionae]MXP09152.1 alpha/beta fold hydrolase [Alteriqipengyuania halimionae]
MKIAVACFALLFATPLAAQPAEEVAITFEAQDGQRVAAFRGEVQVPENRSDPASRTITLSYVRFPSTSDIPGPPIVYLAGGPGGSGSGTAERDRFPLFMAMRRHGDVIAFDQRGTGGSTALPRCQSSIIPSQTEALSDDEYAELHRAAARECAAFWQSEGIDIGGYTTLESVRDLSALRQHLGADRVVLWGISYGTHLALAAIDAIPTEIDRAILASAEGLDQTVKLPTRTDAYFARLQSAIDTQPNAKALYPDVKALMRKVHQQLEKKPLMLDIPTGDGSAFPFLFQRRHMQHLASSLIADPGNAALLLELYRSIGRGDAMPIARVIGAWQREGEAIALSPMSTAMDVASGISAERLALFDIERRDALLGGYLNFPMPQLVGVWPEIELDDDFRDGPVGETPVLLLTGTLDGRTYPEGQYEAVAGLTNVTAITVEGAGHNLFMTSPQVEEAMHRFMQGETQERRTIEVPLPDLAALPDWFDAGA